MKLLYDYKLLGTDKAAPGVFMSTLLNHLPAVQIREFLPDTRLDQCINFFMELFQSMANVLTNKDEKDNVKKNDSANVLDRIAACAEFTISYMTGNCDPNFYTDLRVNQMTPPYPFSSYKTAMWSEVSDTESPGYYVMTFPFLLYYRLQSCVTTNLYQVPAIQEPKRIISNESGMNGWGGGDDLMSEGGFRVSKALSKLGPLGNIANMIIGNIGINYMPWWNAEAGTKNTEPTVDIKFDLFNDSYSAAMSNFIFVNTIVPNNKWVQYNMFQHSPNIYDIKIEGINRLYACSGSFNVTYDGVLRDPPASWVEDLVKKHANLNIEQQAFIDNILKNKIIKIPDVYHVEMHFQSLLPPNFNNFIFNYAGNDNELTTYKDHVYDPTYGDAFGSAIANFGKRVVEVWDAGDASAVVKFRD